MLPSGTERPGTSQRSVTKSNSMKQGSRGDGGIRGAGEGGGHMTVDRAARV